MITQKPDNDITTEGWRGRRCPGIIKDVCRCSAERLDIPSHRTNQINTVATSRARTNMSNNFVRHKLTHLIRRSPQEYSTFSPDNKIQRYTVARQMTVLYTTFLNIKAQIKHSERVFYNCHTAHVTGRLSQTTYNLAAFNGLNRIIYNSYYMYSIPYRKSNMHLSCICQIPLT